jgi:hypothetical protein
LKKRGDISGLLILIKKLTSFYGLKNGIISDKYKSESHPNYYKERLADLKDLLERLKSPTYVEETIKKINKGE